MFTFKRGVPMKIFTRVFRIVLTVSIILICTGALQKAESEVRVRGSIGLQGYGYETRNDEDHIWLIQSTRFSVTDKDCPVSFHFSGGYIGDNGDEFSASGRGRFKKGYLQYGRMNDHTKIKIGRFFMYKGVALGVLDGLEYQRKLSNKYRISVFAGILGSLSRKFEFEKPAESLSFGGELKWMPGSIWHFRNTNLSLSYTRQTRNNLETRHRIGLNAFASLCKKTNVYAVIQLRPSASPIRKLVGRARYADQNWSGMIEGSFVSVDVADYSWLSGFENSTYTRLRFSVDRKIISNPWSIGVDGSYMFSEEPGIRIGPFVTIPYGQVGYRISIGDRGKSDGLWASLHYSPIKSLEVYASGSLITYEWEAYDIESEELTMFQTGLRYSPCCWENVTLSGEYQVYQSTEFTRERRLLGRIKWQFDHERTK